jgi:glycosyltransferase involved in cell wall biosynthesis
MVTAYTITYRQPDRLALTLRDLLAQDYPLDRFEIVVLDDGSGDETQDVLAARRSASPVPLRVLSVEHERDYHSSRRWNQCIAAASPATAVFVQFDDVRLRPDFLRRHVGWHLDGVRRLISGAKFEGPGAEPVWRLDACRRRAVSPDGGAAPCNYLAIWGASLSFGRELMASVVSAPHDNPYDERMTGWGWHEVELAYRMERAGAELVYDPAAGVYHQLHAPDRELRERRLDREAEVSRNGERNKGYFRAKHGLTTLPWWGD